MTPLFVFSLDFWISCSKHIFGVLSSSWPLSRTQQVSSSNLFWLVITYSDKEGILLSVQKMRKIHQILFCRNAVCNFHGLNKLWREEYGNLRYNFRALCRILWVFKSFKTFSLSKRQKSFPIGESAGTQLNFDLNGAAKDRDFSTYKV